MLEIAAYWGHLKVIEFVLNETNFSEFVVVNLNLGPIQRPALKKPLFIAAEKGRLDIVKFLYSKGASVNALYDAVSFFLMNFCREFGNPNRFLIFL